MNNKPSKEILEQWHRDPENWIWGVFYFNKKDPRLLPPKRIAQMGWTVNFANPYSVLLLVILLLFIPFIVWLAACLN